MKRKKRNAQEKNSLIVYITANLEVSFEFLFSYCSNLGLLLYQLIVCPPISYDVNCDYEWHFYIRSWIVYVFFFFFFIFLYVLVCVWTRQFNHYVFLLYSFVRSITCTSYIDMHFVSFVVSYANTYIHEREERDSIILYFLFSNYIIWYKNVVSQSFPSLV